MLLATLHETATAKSAVQAVMAAGFPHIEEGEDFIIEDDGSISPPGDIGDREFRVPYNWDRLKVKFNAWPTLSFVGGSDARSQLKSLENFPPELDELRLYKVDGLASLRGDVKKVNKITLSQCGLTSLTGMPQADIVEIIELKRLTSLKGLEGKSFTTVDISECSGLKSLDGAPHSVETFAVSDCNELEVIKLENTRMVGRGTLWIDAELTHKLSPSLVLVPGLKEIRYIGHGYRHDILKIFEKHLNQPNPRRAYLQLQQDLIDANMEYIAEL